MATTIKTQTAVPTDLREWLRKMRSASSRP